MQMENNMIASAPRAVRGGGRCRTQLDLCFWWIRQLSIFCAITWCGTSLTIPEVLLATRISNISHEHRRASKVRVLEEKLRLLEMVAVPSENLVLLAEQLGPKMEEAEAERCRSRRSIPMTRPLHWRLLRYLFPQVGPVPLNGSCDDVDLSE